MYHILPLFKSHYSIGRSILTLDKPDPKKAGKYSSSIFDLLKKHGMTTLVLVEDSLSGLLQASQNCADNGIKLVFGLRIDITDDVTLKDENTLKKRAKYIIFARNSKAYAALLKIASFAAKEGFYYSPSIDFKNLKKLWDKENLQLAIPFYDSFLHLNSLESHLHVPDFSFLKGQNKPFFLVEDNDMPFDYLLKEKVENYCKQGDYDMLDAQSIFYISREDFPAYVAFRCIHNRGHTQKSTIESPELDHMNSDTFCFEYWQEREKQ